MFSPPDILISSHIITHFIFPTPKIHFIFLARADSLPLDIESVLANACQLCSFDLKTMTVQDAQDVQVKF